MASSCICSCKGRMEGQGLVMVTVTVTVMMAAIRFKKARLVVYVVCSRGGSPWGLLACSYKKYNVI